ncbi:aldehyde dehydrogenase family protein [Nocardia sp. NPDC005746]|uniref:aldehyde dehydrogenase family protein n=1 Tax=Nocardia sp. NPDC005746 TaxID=3157062 RepID=UPI003401282A
MTSASHVGRVDDQVRAALATGATLRCGGRATDVGFEPTVLGEVGPAMAVFTQQTLGPVLPVVRVGDAGAAFDLAGRTPAGPCVSVWTGDTVAAGRAAARLAPALGRRQRRRPARGPAPAVLSRRAAPSRCGSAALA